LAVRVLPDPFRILLAPGTAAVGCGRGTGHVTPALGLPPLPASEVVLFARVGSPAVASALLRALAAGVLASLR
jgi:hypothetical protein